MKKIKIQFIPNFLPIFIALFSLLSGSVAKASDIVLNNLSTNSGLSCYAFGKSWSIGNGNGFINSNNTYLKSVEIGSNNETSSPINRLLKEGNPTDSVKMTIREASNPSTILYTSQNAISAESIGALNVGPTYSNYTFNFDYVFLEANKLYLLMFERTGGYENTNFYYICGENTENAGQYIPGHFFAYFGTNLYSAYDGSNQDLSLKITYSETPGSYCGDTICQTTTESCSTCPGDCGECASNPNASDSIGLFFFSNPYTFSNQLTAKIRYLYNENIFTSHDYIELRKISADWSTSSFMATSTIIDDTGFFSDKRNGKSFFTITGDGSTVGYVHYEVIGHLAAYWSPNFGDVAATTTVPYIVSINWQTMEIPTAADILAASSTNPFYDDQAMYDAACDQTQWNTPNPEFLNISMPALNFTVIGCKFKLGFIIAGNKFTTIATDGIYKAGNILRNVFPFNIFTNLNSAWQASANANVISELSFLSPVNGNLTAQIPTPNGTSATIVLWGKDIFTSSETLGANNAQKTNQMFLAIKTIIKWALWGLFGLWAIKNGKAFVEKMTEGQ